MYIVVDKCHSQCGLPIFNWPDEGALVVTTLVELLVVFKMSPDCDEVVLTTVDVGAAVNKPKDKT